MTRVRSTAFDFMAAVVITLVIGQLVLAIWFLIYEKETYRKARETSSAMEAKFLAEYSAEYLSSGERSSLDSFVATLRADSDILSIQIRRSDGLVVLSERLGEEQEPSSLAPFYIPTRNSVHAPIRSGGAVTGEVELEYSGASVNGQIKRLMTMFPSAAGRRLPAGRRRHIHPVSRSDQQAAQAAGARYLADKRRRPDGRDPAGLRAGDRRRGQGHADARRPVLIRCIAAGRGL